ncbi:hypothetical protein M5689_006349 [Euphorbia peplus]|nr:hypothetical protein M5689_006349 [Euphorbia peplus]
MSWIQKFRFENTWLEEGDCRDRITSAWNSYTGFDFLRKQQACVEVLFEWVEEIRRQFKGQISNCRIVLKRLRSKTDSNFQNLLIENRRSLNALLLRQEVYWQQRAKKIMAQSW